MGHDGWGHRIGRGGGGGGCRHGLQVRGKREASARRAFVLYRVDDEASPRGPLGTRRSLISNGAALLPAAAAAAQRVFPRE